MTEDASRNNMSNQKTEVNPSSKRKDSEEESRLREKLKRKKEGRDRDRDRDRDLHRPKNEASSATTSKQPVATKDKLPPDASGKITGRDKESSNGNGKSAMDKPSKSGTDIQDKTSTSRGRSGSGSNTNANSKSGSKRNRNKRRRERRRDVARDRMRNEAPGYRGHGHGPPGPYGGGHDPRHGHDPRFGHGHGFPHGHGPPEMMDSRSYYSQDFHYGMGGPGRHEPPYGREPYRGGGGGRGGGGWDGRPRGGYPDGRGGGRYDDHRGSVDRDRDRFGRHYRGGERGRSRSRSFSRSRSRNRSGSSISDRSYSSASNRSYSSGGSRSSSRSRSYSSSSSRSRSRNRDRSHSSDHHSKSRSKSRSRGRRSPTDRKRQRRSSSASSKNAPGANKNSKEDELTKDQRTVFVSQLVMKAGERDIQKYFNKKLGLKVNDVILLRDKRTGRHKGCAYVELANLVDVPKSVEASGKVPDFQRFPILVKASEAEKNGVVTNISVGVGGMGALGLGVVDESNKRTEAQKLYIGNIDQAVTQSQLYAIFSQFGQLDRVLLQLDPATGLSKGFAFLSFQDPKVANLAMTTVSGQILAGKAIKTGWANQNSSVVGLEEVSSTEFPEDSMTRIEKANVVFKQLNGNGLAQTMSILLVPGMASLILESPAAKSTLTPEAISAQYAILAEEAVNLALGQTPSIKPSVAPLPVSLQAENTDDPKMVQGDLSRHILVRNMFDKDEETEEGWAEDIKLDFQEEGGKHGKITDVKVMSKEGGGKIYTSFESLEGAAACAGNLAGRWFDKRQLQVEFVSDAVMSAAASQS